jgi:hypothetical protein
MYRPISLLPVLEVVRRRVLGEVSFMIILSFADITFGRELAHR